MQKHPIRNKIIEKLHRGFVFTCIGVTLYGTSVIVFRWYKYFTEIKPQAEQQKLIEKQKLLAEGSSEILKDKAPSFS